LSAGGLEGIGHGGCGTWHIVWSGATRRVVEELARRHELLEVGGRGPVRSLGPQLARIDRTLHKAYHVLVAALRREVDATPAAEWLVDNFYVILEQVGQVRELLPAGYRRRLPRLSSGPLRGMPRIYELVRELAQFTDNVLDVDILGRFVQPYQEVDTFQIGELWAIPILVRFVLLERLAEVADALRRDQLRRIRTRAWVDRLATVEGPKVASVLDRLARKERGVDVSFLSISNRGWCRPTSCPMKPGRGSSRRISFPVPIRKLPWRG
jgi:hypothetical protein